MDSSPGILGQPWPRNLGMRKWTKPFELWAGHLSTSSASWLSLIPLMCTFPPEQTWRKTAACRDSVVLLAIISHQASKTITWLSIFLSYQAASSTEGPLQYLLFILQYWVDRKVVTLWHLFKKPLEVKIPRLCTQALNQSDLMFKSTELWITFRRGQLLWKLVFFDLGP